jgi:hypothetical protein
MASCRSISRTGWRLGLRCLLIAGILAAGGVAAMGQTWLDAVDHTKLKTRLGPNLPTGAGGAISMVEAPIGGDQNTGRYFVDGSSSEFNGTLDPTSTPVTLNDGTGLASNGTSGHATNIVAIPYFGDTGSIAPGANNVTIYEVNNWLGSVLNYLGSNAPVAQPYRVQNHSWIADTYGSTSNEQSILRRFDYLIETGEMTAVVGANNDASPASLLAHPRLMVHSYNAIVAGRTNGAHSRGQTQSVYGSGRFKPDIVAPAALTSTSTAMVSSAATFLHEAVAGTDGARSEVIKAMLMAGATKEEFAAWIDPTTGALNPWDRTQTRPLDDVFGAGELNAYNSYLMTVGGQHAGSTSAPTTAAPTSGWDYKGKTAASELYYNFVIPQGSTASELSIMLAWNVNVTDTPPPGFTPSESLQNLNLALYNSTGSFLGTMLDQSISTVDNVEHIYQTNLQPGTYTLKVSGAANWDYGLAWRMSTQFDQPSADFDGDGFVSGSDFLIWQQNVGTLLGATHAQGDADGDGDVDGDDLVAVNNGVMPSVPPPAALNAVAAIPEPSTLAMAAAAMLAAAGWKWRRLRRG